MSIWQRLSRESPIPADHRTVAQFPVQVETKKGDLKMPVMSLLSKHIYWVVGKVRMHFCNEEQKNTS